MGFEALIEKVRQAESALEAKERQTAADWRQFSDSWRSMWTPGRIVLAGLASGLAVGSAEPLGKVGGGGALQLATALAGLFAGGSAQAAANEAEEAAAAAAPDEASRAVQARAAGTASAEETQRRYREAGLP
jgi:hypothetical protein